MKQPTQRAMTMVLNLALSLAVLGLTACDKPGPEQEAGRQLEEAAENASRMAQHKLDKAKAITQEDIKQVDTAVSDADITAKVKVALMMREGLNSLSVSVKTQAGAFNDDAVAPLLEIALRHAVNPELRLFAKGAGVKKTGGRMHGDIYNTAVGLEWFPTKNVGVVLDYSMSQIDITRDATYETNLKFKVQGPSTFVKVRY
jgi:hypothetical protein